jgi:hypothetical protein
MFDEKDTAIHRNLTGRGLYVREKELLLRRIELSELKHP